jgi:hypothetical protein
LRLLRGEIAQYTWRDVGSSFLLGELAAAYLLPQLEDTEQINAGRMAIWQRYHEAFAALEQAGRVRRPVIPAHCTHNAHIYYLLLEDRGARDELNRAMPQEGVSAYFDYVPLHSAPGGQRFGRPAHDLPVTDSAAARLVRLPLWAGMAKAAVEHVVGAVGRALGARAAATASAAAMDGEQLELTLGPLYLVVVEDRVSGQLTGRIERTYRSPAQPLDDARCLAALLLDRGGELQGDGPWRRPLAGGQRYVEIVPAPVGPLAA